MTRRALFLVNQKARHGQQDLARVRQLLQKGGIDLIEPQSMSENASETIRQFVADADLIILGGGDGTVNQALNGLLDAKLPFGLLPLGTANDLARTLDLPLDPVAACDVILAGRTQLIDVGCVNDQPFVNVASIGLASEVTKQLSRAAKSRWGVLAYVFSAVKAMLRGRPFSVEIRCNGDSLLTRTWQVTVGNGRSYGGGLTIHEGARINDGLLHLYSLEMESGWHILPLLPAMWRGTLDPIHTIRTMQGTSFEVRPISRQRSITADGELVGRTPAVFKVQPQALSVYVTEARAEASEQQLHPLPARP